MSGLVAVDVRSLGRVAAGVVRADCVAGGIASCNDRAGTTGAGAPSAASRPAVTSSARIVSEADSGRPRVWRSAMVRSVETALRSLGLNPSRNAAFHDRNITRSSDGRSQSSTGCEDCGSRPAARRASPATRRPACSAAAMRSRIRGARTWRSAVSATDRSSSRPTAIHAPPSRVWIAAAGNPTFAFSPE